MTKLNAIFQVASIWKQGHLATNIYYAVINTHENQSILWTIQECELNWNINTELINNTASCKCTRHFRSFIPPALPNLPKYFSIFQWSQGKPWLKRFLKVRQFDGKNKEVIIFTIYFIIWMKHISLLIEGSVHIHSCQGNTISLVKIILIQKSWKKFDQV